MKTYRCKATDLTPEIILAPEEDKFIISGKSAPEDVRTIYYPVIEWLEDFMAWVRDKRPYTDRKPLVLQIDLEYFNSSTAKFLYDIITGLQTLANEGTPVEVQWLYDEEDIDLREAGEDLALLCEMQFKYCPKPSGTI